MQVFFAGIVVGVIILQTMIFAPTIFTTIDAAPAGKLLRALFPKFFKLLCILGIASMISALASDTPGIVKPLIAGATIVFPIVCIVIIPITNRATDRGDKATFKKLHTLSVVLTLILLLANIAVPFL
ncbi:MAG: hypothetical protein CMJ41_06710 [Phycisphaerae bacterium]|mgnify:CR=1 FL=1|nr:hypothetical protein [Phycisphaerae bacterium]|tara:strand:+ start:566 stop:946 length:381 start_codon:yes stop_codon:yes gene_type:complete